jgi:uncharacterized membrane protein
MQRNHLHLEDITKPASLSLLFNLGMWWRIVYGFLRLILGITFLRLIGQPLSAFVHTLMSHELTGFFGDAILEKLYFLFEVHEFTITYFIASYFIFWGLTEIVLSLCLLWHIRIAFPITMGLIVLFICYSVYRFAHTHSLILLGIIIIDIAILYLINTEYKKLKRTI